MSKAPCNIASIHTQKFLDENGEYNIKCKEWKTFKKYKFNYEKENMNIVKKQIQEEIKEQTEKKEKLIGKYQKIYVDLIKTSLSKGTYYQKLVQTDEMKNIMYDIEEISNLIKLLEKNYEQLGVIPPRNSRYTNREIVF